MDDITFEEPRAFGAVAVEAERPRRRAAAGTLQVLVKTGSDFFILR